LKNSKKKASCNFEDLESSCKKQNGCSPEEVLASYVYAKFAKERVSKAIAAQYLSDRLQVKYDKEELTAEKLRSSLPKYLVQAIDYVTGYEKTHVACEGESANE
jgi:hypothetical protein